MIDITLSTAAVAMKLERRDVSGQTEPFTKMNMILHGKRGGTQYINIYFDGLCVGDLEKVRDEIDRHLAEITAKVS